VRGQLFSLSQQRVSGSFLALFSTSNLALLFDRSDRQRRWPRGRRFTPTVTICSAHSSPSWGGTRRSFFPPFLSPRDRASLMAPPGTQCGNFFFPAITTHSPRACARVTVPDCAAVLRLFLPVSPNREQQGSFEPAHL